MDEKFIDIAIEISRKAKYPYGAIIVKDGKIIARAHNKKKKNKIQQNMQK